MVRLNISRMCSIFIFFYSIVVMAGWIWGIDSWTRISSNEINMKFAAAGAFFLSSISLWYIELAIYGRKEISQIILPATTLLILLIMATLLAAGIFGVQTGIEDLFVADSVLTKTVIPGMPAIPTMINFILFGIASILAFFEFSTKHKSFTYIGIPISIVGVTAVIGYVFHIPFLYYKFVGSSTPIALNTAILFIVLGLGLLSIRYIEKKYEN